MSKQLDWFIGKQQKYDSVVIGQSKDEVGNCNICRFAGCSECDDCVNGSQWVRMTREDEE